MEITVVDKDDFFTEKPTINVLDVVAVLVAALIFIILVLCYHRLRGRLVVSTDHNVPFV